MAKHRLRGQLIYKKKIREFVPNFKINLGKLVLHNQTVSHNFAISTFSFTQYKVTWLKFHLIISGHAAENTIIKTWTGNGHYAASYL